MESRQTDLDDFYQLLEVLEEKCGGMRRLCEATGRSGWPTRGVYFFFEEGEVRSRNGRLRVVRVGTHALRPSRSTLWGRLSQHRGSVGGSLPGGGNHRGSIFRLHVGTALLASGARSPQLRESWGVGSTAKGDVRRAEQPLERAVSQYIGGMPFLWVDVDDPPSRDSERGVIEAGSLALLSNRERVAIDPPSPQWLGASADRAAVREAGLWNVNHVGDPSNVSFLEILDRRVREIK